MVFFFPRTVAVPVSNAELYYAVDRRGEKDRKKNTAAANELLASCIGGLISGAVASAVL